MDGKRWKIEQLRAIAGAALEAAEVQGPQSKRVRAVPDTRTIRYYTTLGILDRPAEIRGRTAFYQQRHALQLVCVKRLQAQGMTLAQVQHELTGASEAQLRKIAQVPQQFWESAEVSNGDLERPNRASKQASQTEADAVSTNREDSTVDTAGLSNTVVDQTVDASKSDGSKSETADASNFWERAPAPPTPSRPSPLATNSRVCVRIPIVGDASLEIAGDPTTIEHAIPKLTPTLQKLAAQLQELGLVSGAPSEIPNAKPNSPSSED